MQRSRLSCGWRVNKSQTSVQCLPIGRCKRPSGANLTLFNFACTLLQISGLEYQPRAVRSRQMMEHAPRRRVAESTLRRYEYGLHLAIVQADAEPVMHISRRQASVWPSPRQTPGPPCQSLSDRPSPDVTTSQADTNHSDEFQKYKRRKDFVPRDYGVT